MNRHTAGFTLLFSMLVASILLVVCFAILSISTKQIIISGISKESQKAFYAADSGAECVRFWDVSQDAFSTSTVDVAANINCSGITIPVVVSSGDPDINCNTGRGICKERSVAFNLITPGVNVPKAVINIQKNVVTNETQIYSAGQNTDSDTSTRKVGRAIEITYTYAKRGLCGYLDIMFAVDVSGSVADKKTSTGENGFTVLKDALRTTISALKGRSDADVHVGIVPFAHPGNHFIVAHLDASETDLITEVNNFSRDDDGGTDLIAGLALARNELLGLYMSRDDYYSSSFNAAITNATQEDPLHDREDTLNPDALVVITDGEPNVVVKDTVAEGSDGTTHKRGLSSAEKRDMISQISALTTDMKEANDIPIFVIGIAVPQNSDAETILRDDVASPDLYFDSGLEDEGYKKGLRSLLQNMVTCQNS